MRREFRRELRRDDANAVRHSSRPGIIWGAFSQLVRCELDVLLLLGRDRDYFRTHSEYYSVRIHVRQRESPRPLGNHPP